MTTMPITTKPVRIPADVEREDRVLAGLTAHQLTILTVTGVLLYGLYAATSPLLPPAVFALIAVPLAAAAAAVALGSRDGISLDRLLTAALRHHLSPHVQVAAPEGITAMPDWLTSTATSESTSRITPSALHLPALDVTDAGVTDLGPDGLAIVAVASMVNFELRTPAEQEALVAAFGRYLHSLTAPVQILIRAQRLDLSDQVAALHEQAPGLPHPALEAAAREHADYLEGLAEQTTLLRRQVLLVLREPLGAGRRTRRPRPWNPRSDNTAIAAEQRAAEARLARRIGEAATLLSAAGITVTALTAGQATAVLAAACNPDNLIPPTAELAPPDDVITAAPPAEPDPGDEYSPPFVNHEAEVYGAEPPYSAEASGPEWWIR